MAKKAGMATGVEVARITVKVSPDSREFRRDLKEQLKDVDTSLNRAGRRPEINVDPNTDGFGEKAEAKAKAQTRGRSVKIDVDADVEKMKRKIGMVNLSFERSMRNSLRHIATPELVGDINRQIGQIDLGWDKQVEAFKKGVAEAADEARKSRVDLQPDVIKERAHQGGMKTALDYDVSEFQIALKKAQAANNEVEVALRPDVQTGKFVAARESIKAIFRRKIDVQVDVDRSGLDRLSNAFEEALSGAKGLSKFSPGFGSGVNPAGYAVIFAAVMAVAAPLVGLVTTALLTLPGLVSAVLLPIGAVTLGLEGFKKAAETIKPQFESLKQTMSDAAQTAFTPVLKDLADNIFPMLKTNLPAVTQGLADLSQGVLNAFKDPANALMFEATIKRVGAMLSGMNPGFQSMTSGIIGLADQLSQKFPDLTDWFNKTMGDFNTWVQRISANGDLGRAFSGLGDTLKIIGDTVVEMAGKGLDFMKDPQKVADFGAGLKVVGEGMSNIVAASSEFFTAIKQIQDKDWSIGDLLQGEDLGSGGLVYLDQNGNVIRDIENVKDKSDEASVAADKARASLEKVFAPIPNAGGPADPLAALQGNMTTPGTGAPGAPPPEVQAPDTEAAKAKISEYQGFVDSVTQQVRGSLEQATSGESLPAPNFEAFKTAWNELPQFVTTTGQLMVNESMKISQGVSTALAGLGGIGASAGSALMSGLKSGMEAGEGPLLAYVQSIAPKIAQNKGPLPYDKTVLRPNGEALMFGLGKGMEDGFQPILEQARGLADQISAAFAEGTDPTGFLDGLSKEEIKRTEKTLGLETKRLEAQAKALDYQARAAGKGPEADALKKRADEIRQQKDQLSLQKDMIDLTQEYSDTLPGGGDDPLVKAAAGLMKAPGDFAAATGKQFMSDIGISGDGFISRGITEGIKYIFQVGSVDEALSIKDRADSTRALTVSGR